MQESALNTYACNKCGKNIPTMNRTIHDVRCPGAQDTSKRSESSGVPNREPLINIGNQASQEPQIPIQRGKEEVRRTGENLSSELRENIGKQRVKQESKICSKCNNAIPSSEFADHTLAHSIEESSSTPSYLEEEKGEEVHDEPMPQSTRPNSYRLQDRREIGEDEDYQPPQESRYDTLIQENHNQPSGHPFDVFSQLFSPFGGGSLFPSQRPVAPPNRMPNNTQRQSQQNSRTISYINGRLFINGQEVQQNGAPQEESQPHIFATINGQNVNLDRYNMSGLPVLRRLPSSQSGLSPLSGLMGGFGAPQRGINLAFGRGSNQIRIPGLGAVFRFDNLEDLMQGVQEAGKTPLTKEVRENLPVFKFDKAKTEHLSEENKSCQICISEFQDQDKVMLLPCLHRYHEACISPWFEQNDQCPICKSKVQME